MDDQRALVEAIESEEYTMHNIKLAKLNTQDTLETYLEEEHVYDIFQEMMTAVIKEMPKDPIQFLIDKMENPDCKYIIQVTFFELDQKLPF